MDRIDCDLRGVLCLAVVCVACSSTNAGGDGASGTATETTTDATTVGTDPTTQGTVGETSVSTSGTTQGDGPKFDVGGEDVQATDTGPPVDMCKVADDMDAVGDCEAEAPPDSFEPDVQWTWTGPGLENSCTVTALVANLTDDNDDGEIDLCDVPDIVVIAYTNQGGPSHLYVLDGATGALHFSPVEDVSFNITPAIGDVDNDGIPEIVTLRGNHQLVIFEHDGSVKLQSGWTWPVVSGHAMALADLDNDGDVEIFAAAAIADHDGNMIVTLADDPGDWGATAAADLDDDGDLEVVLGRSAFHHDGTQVYLVASIADGFPQIADLDADPDPEVLINNRQGISMLEHDGTVKFVDLRPTADPASGLNWIRPSTVHDFDGDGDAEFAVSSRDHYATYEATPTVIWSSDVLDATGIAAGTAFDFLGDGIAEAMYADETQLFVFDGAGVPLLTNPRTSVTWSEYPVVADVDNDGSAEIVVVSNTGFGNSPQMNPPWDTVKVIRDVQDRWIQARRIWNQHTYHVTNVREDGTIPQFEPPSWTQLNTYRTNAQIEGGEVCKPDPEG